MGGITESQQGTILISQQDLIPTSLPHEKNECARELSSNGKETDFLIVRDRKPWCLFEAKLQDEAVARHHIDQARALGNVPLVQLVREGNIYKKSAPSIVRVSASRFF